MRIHLLIFWSTIAITTNIFDSFTNSFLIPTHERIRRTRNHHGWTDPTHVVKPEFALVRSLSRRDAYPPRRGGRDSKNKTKSNGNEDESSPKKSLPRKGIDRASLNWIEKSSPVGIGKLSETKSSTSEEKSTNKWNVNKKEGPDGNYDLGIDGESFSIGPLSLRMYSTLLSVALKRFPPGTKALPSELDQVYKIYAMDISAKEAVKAALSQNGLELAVSSDDEKEQDTGMWGEIDSIQLLDLDNMSMTDISTDIFYDSLEDAVERGNWNPGQSFHFIVRNVPAKLKELDISELLNALDPNGTYRSEAKERGIVLPDEDITTLREMGNDNERRANVTPNEAESEDTVYKGDGSMGYNIIHRCNLSRHNANMTEDQRFRTTMHVMDALVNHGCLVVDLTDGGTTYDAAITLANMWNVTSLFFQTIDDDKDLHNTLPPLKVAEGAGSRHAVVGFANYDNGNMQFLETRLLREEDQAKLIPKELENIVGRQGVSCLAEAFRTMSDLGKDCTAIPIAAVSTEVDAFKSPTQPLNRERETQENNYPPSLFGVNLEDETEVEKYQAPDNTLLREDAQEQAARLATEAASRLVDDLIDDGRSHVYNFDEGLVCMSPHRVCRYTDQNSRTGFAETFGAHTDTTFVTMVPVAAVSGLEIFDEKADKWLRPELMAKEKWISEQVKRGRDPSRLTETVVLGEDEKVELPWHCRYVVVMPGEFLQLFTRNEIAASVHRVVTVTNGKARLSAPVLLRARPGMRLDIEKYFGRLDKATALLQECEGMKMEEIHDALQPSSFR